MHPKVRTRTSSASRIKSGGTATYTRQHGAPILRKRVGGIARVHTTVGSQIVPLQYHQITRDIIWQFHSESVVDAIETSAVLHNVIVAGRRNVGSVGVVGILDSSIQCVRDEFERISFETISCWGLTMVDGARKELEVALMMSRQNNLKINLLSLRIGSLWICWHNSTVYIQGDIVIGCFCSVSAYSPSIGALRTTVFGIIAVATAVVASIFISNKVSSSVLSHTDMA